MMLIFLIVGSPLGSKLQKDIFQTHFYRFDRKQSPTALTIVSVIVLSGRYYRAFHYQIIAFFRNFSHSVNSLQASDNLGRWDLSLPNADAGNP